MRDVVMRMNLSLMRSNEARRTLIYSPSSKYQSKSLREPDELVSNWVIRAFVISARIAEKYTMRPLKVLQMWR